MKMRYMLIDCTFYTDECIYLLRVVLVKHRDFFTNLPCNIDAFLKIMSCEDENISFHIAKFIFKCFKKRSS